MEPSFDATSVQPPSELRRLLAECLQQDRWRENVRWTPWQEVKRFQPGRPYYRWVYGADGDRSEVTIRSQSADSDPNTAGRGASVEISNAADSRSSADPDGRNRRQSETGASRSVPVGSGQQPASEPRPAAGGRPDAALLGGERSGQPLAPPEPSQAWDGFWPLDPIRVLTDASTDGHSSDEFLKALRELANQEGPVGWNAVILLAQQDMASAHELVGRLQQLVSGAVSGGQQGQASRSGSGDESTRPDGSRQPASPSPSLRAAAAEVWCYLLVQEAAGGDLIERQTALAPAGRMLLRKDLPNAVRAELFRGCGRYIPPDQIPRLENALERAPDGQRAPVPIRCAAMEACVLFALYKGRFPEPVGRSRKAGSRDGRKQGDFSPNAGSRPDGTSRRAANPFAEYDEWDWPASIWNGQDDPDARVRILFGQWLAAARPSARLGSTFLEAVRRSQAYSEGLMDRAVAAPRGRLAKPRVHWSTAREGEGISCPELDLEVRAVK